MTQKLSRSNLIVFAALSVITLGSVLGLTTLTSQLTNGSLSLDLRRYAKPLDEETLSGGANSKDFQAFQKEGKEYAKETNTTTGGNQDTTSGIQCISGMSTKMCWCTKSTCYMNFTAVYNGKTVSYTQQFPNNSATKQYIENLLQQLAAGNPNLAPPTNQTGGNTNPQSPLTSFPLNTINPSSANINNIDDLVNGIANTIADCQKAGGNVKNCICSKYSCDNPKSPIAHIANYFAMFPSANRIQCENLLNGILNNLLTNAPVLNPLGNTASDQTCKNTGNWKCISTTSPLFNGLKPGDIVYYGNHVAMVSNNMTLIEANLNNSGQVTTTRPATTLGASAVFRLTN